MRQSPTSGERLESIDISIAPVRTSTRDASAPLNAAAEDSAGFGSEGVGARDSSASNSGARPITRRSTRSTVEMSTHNYVRYEELASHTADLGSGGFQGEGADSQSLRGPPWCRGIARLVRWCGGGKRTDSRLIRLNAKRPTDRRYCRNVINNQKFSLLTFFPKVLYEQFKFFFNLYFLIVAVSQFFPPLKVGFLFTYIAPLAFVLAITIIKEAHDDFKRMLSDRKLNGEMYDRLLGDGRTERVPSSKIRVGDLIRIHTNQRVPADCVLVRTTEHSGTVFLRTDQLDGETDWKLRVAVPSCQKLATDADLQRIAATLYAGAPSKAIYEFVGEMTTTAGQAGGAGSGGAAGTAPGHGGVAPPTTEPLGLENTMWCNTVLASGMAIGVVVFTGNETRCMMNASATPTKVSGLDLQINFLAKFLFCLTVTLSALMVLIPPDHSPSPLLKLLAFFRFILLFSSIVPISLRVSLEMAKVTYALHMFRDSEMKGAIVRSSSISEELGGIEYLLTDKTGTLTRNEMVFRKLHLGSHCLTAASLEEVRGLLREAYRSEAAGAPLSPLAHQTRSALLAIALCHNVSPVEGGDSFQGASPDELALVSFAAATGLKLVRRDLQHVVLQRAHDDVEMVWDVLQEFPFTSETKRMGIMLRERETGQMTFLVKGADTVMAEKVARSYWLEEEVGNLAREGLRTLVVARRPLTEAAYRQFETELQAARLAKTAAGREQAVRECVDRLEVDMDLLCLTAVEDLLQNAVQQTLEKLRNANVKTWMLTGDKLETAMVIAQNASLVPRGGAFYPVVAKSPVEALQKLRGYPQGVLHAPCLLVDGNSLELCLQHHQVLFLEVACAAPAVICCRCSPTQKGQIVRLIRTHTGKCTAAIGDGGNDIPMIREAHVGIGIEGKEGKQASMAADFSLTEFSHLQRLVLWHGRNSYLRSALLAQFVIHRGLIIAIIQAVFSSLFFFASIAVYNGYLTVGYATIFTTGPVFSLVLDEDISAENALKYPELYRELQKRRHLSLKTFLIWTWKAIYQGGVIMLGAIYLFDRRLVHVVGITFTALILTELIMVAVEVKRWHTIMIASEVVTLAVYAGSIFALSSPTMLGTSTFDLPFMLSVEFLWKVAAITAVSCVPVWVGKVFSQRLSPEKASKIR
eukprot:CAMPEP_0185166076 /NCGR_PEP_ID=MMETSP1139-20130426/11948_1 /TAXON_ID=298111 /ORGANISM="Pavlova sp., Strain CCMP459" /LENGTH=1146 /DNA_ID=CAMNT_0027731509 /DNA_START=1 /DNA_END=3441 /DNA_ORIENTATION=-